MNTYQTLDLELNNHILTLTLNRPEAMNAFTPLMCRELIEVFDEASVNDEVRVIVVTGSGRAFCAGMDLSKEGNVFGLNESLSPNMRDLNERFDDPEIVDGVRDTGGRVALSIFNCDKPVIGAINGAAVGIGATMTCAMDIRLASTKAKIGFIFSKVGIVPEACSSWFLPRIVGMQTALKWTLTGDIFGSEEALKTGFVTQVCEPDDLLTQAYAIATQIASRSGVSAALIRRMMYQNSALTPPAYAHKVESLGMFYTSLKDGKEGVASFLEKREQNFSAKVSTDLPPIREWLREIKQ